MALNESTCGWPRSLNPGQSVPFHTLPVGQRPLGAAERPAKAELWIEKLDQNEASGCDALRIACGVCPKARRNARRMRSRSPKPVSFAIASTGRRPCSSASLAASSLRFSIALAGDCPVSMRNTRLNWRGLRRAASASRSTDNGSWRLRLAKTSASCTRSDFASSSNKAECCDCPPPRGGDEPQSPWRQRGPPPALRLFRPGPVRDRCRPSFPRRSKPGHRR
jgi:hypothetical protein